LTLAEALVGQPIAPPEPPTQIEALVEELKALHTEELVYGEPTSPCENRNRDHADDAMCLRGFFKYLDYDMDFLGTLLCASNRDAADVILPAIKASCNDIKHDLDQYQKGDVSDDPAAGAKALVFYRRHSFPLKPHLTTEEFDFYESMSRFLVCVLRRAGYTVNGSLSQ
jgi:hypothetical protein